MGTKSQALAELKEKESNLLVDVGELLNDFDGTADPRLVAIARTQIELGFMALRKAVEQGN